MKRSHGPRWNVGATFHTMLSAQKLGFGWFVLGPHSLGGETWTFEMIFAVNAEGRFRVPGVEWAQIQLMLPVAEVRSR